MSLPPVYRIYAKGKPYRHLGNVEARSETEALEKAVKGTWKLVLVDLARDQPTSADNLIAFL